MNRTPTVAGGSPITAMYASNCRSPWDSPEFPLVVPSPDHTVLYQVTNKGLLKVAPLPMIDQEPWDDRFVKLPFGNEDHWNRVFEALSVYINNSDHLASAILKYNNKIENVRGFAALHEFFKHHIQQTEAENFFTYMLPEIIKLAMRLPELIKSHIPLLKKGVSMSISMSQLQIASLMANAFLCTYPSRDCVQSGEYGDINLTTLYKAVDFKIAMEKLKCVVQYFGLVISTEPTGVVTFSRRAVPHADLPRWHSSDTPIGSIPLHADNSINIDKADGMIQVDFANKSLGGDVLGTGCGDEEIRFLTCPELIVTSLFTEKLEANEAVMIIGCQRYCDYVGYDSASFKFMGKHVDETPVDCSGRRRCVVLAIDAEVYHNPADQYQTRMILRELNKAWVGFSFHTDPRSRLLEYPGVATGNWGCGAFSGSPQLKALVQLMAAAQARRPLGYFTPGDAMSRNEILEIYTSLKDSGVTIEKLYGILTEYCKAGQRVQLHTYIQQNMHTISRSGGPAKMLQDPVSLSLISTKESVPKASNSAKATFEQISPATFSNTTSFGTVLTNNHTISRSGGSANMRQDPVSLPFISSQESVKKTSNSAMLLSKELLEQMSPATYSNTTSFGTVSTTEQNFSGLRLDGAKRYKGCPLTAIHGSRSPWQVPEFPEVQSSQNHAVLCLVSSHEVQNVPPQPQPGQDMWDANHVKMPFSSRSLHGVTTTYNIQTTTEPRWDIIQKVLTRKPITNSTDLATAILEYNTKFNDIWTFSAMHKFFNHYLEKAESQRFFKQTLPATIRLAMDLPSILQAPIPLNKKGINASVSLSQLQIASLLANAFFCTYPRRNTTEPGSEFGEYPRINFSSLYEITDKESVMEKLRCIIHYFDRVARQQPTGVVTFSRRAVLDEDCPNWDNSDVPISSIPVTTNDGLNIENADGFIQVDFANKFLGGDILGEGWDAEVVRFLTYPELMVSMLFTENLNPNEAVLVIGCERYSNYSHFNGTFRFAGDHVDATPMDSSGRRRCAVLAIDAHSYSFAAEQYQERTILRELNKAWVGFSFHTDPRSPVLEYPGVATGNWGCGAFGGSPQLKALVQLMAAAQARRPLGYFVNRDTKMCNEVLEVYTMLKDRNITVGQLYKMLIAYCQTNQSIYLPTYIDQKSATVSTYKYHQSQASSESDSESSDGQAEDTFSYGLKPVTKNKTSNYNPKRENKRHASKQYAGNNAPANYNANPENKHHAPRHYTGNAPHKAAYEPGNKNQYRAKPKVDPTYSSSYAKHGRNHNAPSTRTYNSGNVSASAGWSYSGQTTGHVATPAHYSTGHKATAPVVPTQRPRKANKTKPSEQHKTRKPKASKQQLSEDSEQEESANSNDESDKGSDESDKGSDESNKVSDESDQAKKKTKQTRNVSKSRKGVKSSKKPKQPDDSDKAGEEANATASSSPALTTALAVVPNAAGQTIQHKAAKKGGFSAIIRTFF